jgi:hypothetical protein
VFFNAFDDKHCGGCGRRLRPAGTGPEEPAEPGTYAPGPPPTDDIGFGDEAAEAPAPAAGAAIAGPGQEGVSQSEIDGLFDNILDEEGTEGEA